MNKHILILIGFTFVVGSAGCGMDNAQTQNSPEGNYPADAYIRQDAIDTNFTSWVDDIDLPPLFLVERFGEPIRDNGFRVTGRYSFVSPTDDIFTVYDYKQTWSYHQEAEYPTQERFWASRENAEFSIGAKQEYSDAAKIEFKQWLQANLKAWEGDQ